MRLNIGSGAYQLGDSAEFSAQRMVNAYVEVAPPGAEVPAYVRQRYGIADWAEIGSGACRGGGEVRNRLYVVIGSKAYLVSSAGAGTELGDVFPTGAVTVRGDETNVAFLVGTTLYYWNGSAFAQVTDEDAPNTEWLEVIDGYYLGSARDTGQFMISANRDPSSWNALDFASAEKYPDDIVTGIVDHGEAIIFGTTSGEVYYNSGNADFPLDKVASGHFEIGCLSVHGPAKLDNTVFFPGSDYVVYRLDGYVPVRISTHSIELKLKRSGITDLKGFAWTEGGHKFYSLSCSLFTVVYDVSTQLWFDCESYGFSCWNVSFIASCYGKTLIGNSVDNQVGESTPSVITDFGTRIVSLGTLQPISDNGNWVPFNRLELMFESGIGNLTETNPQVMVRWSDDRGKTWSSEHWRRLGAQGEYQNRQLWNRMGRGRQRIYEWSVSSAVRRTLIGATLNENV